MTRAFVTTPARNLLASVVSVALALMVAEIALRLFFPVNYLRPPPHMPDDVWREVLHQPSSVPGLAYELVPNREQWSHNAWIRTNSFGMRDAEPLSPEDDSLCRIVVIGDSYTFGSGVRGAESYPSVLERLLNQETEGDKFEVLNLGVGGYSTRDQSLVLEHKGAMWEPDLVIVGYVLNDPETRPVQPLHRYFNPPRWW